MNVTLNIAKLDARSLLNAIASFCKLHGAPRCYQNWSPETLRDYLAWHANNNTLVWLAVPVPNDIQGLSAIIGTGVAWQTSEELIRRENAAGGYRFDFDGAPAGDAVFFADIVCCQPGALESILSEFARRFPHWAKLKWFTYRRGKLLQLTRRHLITVLRKANYEQCQTS